MFEFAIPNCPSGPASSIKFLRRFSSLEVCQYILEEIIGLIENGKQLALEKSSGDCTLVGEKQINHSSTLDLYLETNGMKTAVALCILIKLSLMKTQLSF